MKKVLYILTCMVLMATSSCIGWGLEELPAFEEAEIRDFDFEHRYIVKNENGVEQLAVMKLITEVEIGDGAITNTITIPDPSGSFTAEVASQVTLSKIIAYADVSTAAHIAPVNGAPVLGKWGDFSSTVNYEVTAANGNKKTWSVTTVLNN